MTYEEEQIKYAEELKDVTNAIRTLEELFKDSYQTNAKIWEYYVRLHPTDARLSSRFEIQQKVNVLRHFLEEDYQKKSDSKERVRTTFISDSIREDKG